MLNIVDKIVNVLNINNRAYLNKEELKEVKADYLYLINNNNEEEIINQLRYCEEKELIKEFTNKLKTYRN